MKLFTNVSLIISLISLISVILILKYLIPKLIKLLNKNNELKQILSNDLISFIALLMLIHLDYSLLETSSLYVYVLLQLLSIAFVMLNELNRCIKN